MLLSLRASSSRLVSSIPARSLSTTPPAFTKIPLRPNKFVAEPSQLLTIIGRNADTRLAEQGESWEKLTEIWMKGGPALAEAGLGVKDRRYIMSAFARFSQGFPPKKFARQPKPPKKFRGWGPDIQHGVRVRGKGMKRPLA